MPVALCCFGLLGQDSLEEQEEMVAPPDDDDSVVVPPGLTGVIIALILLALEFKMLSFREKVSDVIMACVFKNCSVIINGGGMI